MTLPQYPPDRTVVRPPLIVIAGPTASGKTALSLALAGALAGRGIPAEIISADSRQVYRGMDIGTAKVTPQERGLVAHHGLDLVNPDEPFSVSDFAAHAETALSGIAARGGVAILAGGTGFYLRAVARGIALDELPWDEAVRADIDARLEADGLPALVDELRRVAPRRAESVDLNNPRRVVRALEIARISGDGELPKPRGYGRDVLWLGLAVPVQTLQARIDQRARAQFDAGLVDETRALIDRYDPVSRSFSGIGYAEALGVIRGEMSIAEAVVVDARRNLLFSRRQATWFRREPDILWLEGGAALPVAQAVNAATRYLETAG
jgi:tRNA dimethylallyltransferase